MASWQFTDTYGAQYPSLASSVLGMVVFSSYSLEGTSFTGTLDVAASGASLETLGAMLNLTSIPVSGTVTNTNDTLTVSLQSTDNAAFTAGVAGSIPLIGGEITQNAWLAINVVATTNDDPSEGPKIDKMDLVVILAVGSHSVQIDSQVPMNGGFFTLVGTFTNVGISLEDLNFLMGSLAGGNAWFPAEQLGPYYNNGLALSLLDMSLTMYIQLNPMTVTMSSITVNVGITNIPLLGQKLYMNPLGVGVTVTNPTSNPQAVWGLEGALVLCNYARPGDTANPDFIFEFALGFPSKAQPMFTFSSQLENPSKLPVDTMLQDLLGSGIGVGLAETLTINSFELSADADSTSGQITDFSTGIVMSGGFGLFASTGFDVEEISVQVEYSP